MADEGPVNAFLSIQDVKQGNASGILDAIYAAFEEAGIDDWKDRLVGFGSRWSSSQCGMQEWGGSAASEGHPRLISIHRELIAWSWV
ncbi:hypothetical protein UPYG_G00026020 [Umbra pygmaea]|uniref:Uncharacterized protein n=1 Tax=Umbra pygmaea TaxID=75934 RepID=A0ABD0XLU3_UMBPY